ncbi:hypothetical protein N7466_009433 [Penicillium verhagenii]|uniref:uncharacterized protein n=1 Tax=Penicillium verhagenii TaxID=1562060 RepID=UPI002544D608|nr:uncharacterized protein N7466_009433 [Penicillium verhagenii]KAJ5921107.1 hypothetical protein N7466_009433 [Penicillium verhagenii]
MAAISIVGRDVASSSVNDNHIAQILSVQTIFTFSAVTAVALRLYVRIKLIKNPGYDDLCMSVAARHEFKMMVSGLRTKWDLDMR